MSFATEINKTVIQQAADKFPLTMSQWTLKKVYYDFKTNTIKARLKNDTIGQISGVVKPDFELREKMEFSEIQENLTLDFISFTESFITIADKVFNTPIE